MLVLSLQRGSVIVDVCLLPPLRATTATPLVAPAPVAPDARSPKILAYELAAQVGLKAGCGVGGSETVVHARGWEMF